MRKLYIYILVIFVCSCATDVIMVDITDYDTIVTDSTSYNDKYKIGFKADINSLYNTKSIIPFPENCYSNIYAYKSGANPLNKPCYSMQVYKSKKEGTLTPISYELSLPKGNYDIYSVSSTRKNSNQGPNFTNGAAKNLSNGIDYLWWNMTNVKVEDEDRIIPIVYEHCCSQIILEFSTHDGMTLDALHNVNIQLGIASQNKFNLSTGVISYSTQLNKSKTNMNILDNKYAYIIALPLKTNKTLSIDIYASVTIEIIRWWWFDVELPMPKSGAFEPGKSYIYSLIFDKYKVWGFSEDPYPKEGNWINMFID